MASGGEASEVLLRRTDSRGRRTLKVDHVSANAYVATPRHALVLEGEGEGEGGCGLGGGCGCDGCKCYATHGKMRRAASGEGHAFYGVTEEHNVFLFCDFVV